VGQLLTIADLQKYEGKQDDLRKLLRQVSVVSRLDAFLEDLNSEPNAPMPVAFTLNSHRAQKCFHPSSIGSLTGKSLCEKYPMGCSRILYYDYVGADSEGAIDPRLRRIFDTGSAIHAQLQAYLMEIAHRSDKAEDFMPEAFFSPEISQIADQYDISGSTDGIYKILKPDRIHFGIEIKTINHAGYEKTTSPHPEHLIQGTVYQKCLDLPVMLFVYYNKNDSSIAEFVQVFDEKRWEAITRKLDYVRDHALREEEPSREDGWHCSTCKYKAICKPPKRSRASVPAGAGNFRRQKDG
jgi:CRISPR/Cas system-associated exonuclease Cas4 (RecB family)